MPMQNIYIYIYMELNFGNNNNSNNNTIGLSQNGAFTKGKNK